MLHPLETNSRHLPEGLPKRITGNVSLSLDKEHTFSQGCQCKTSRTPSVGNQCTVGRLGVFLLDSNRIQLWCWLIYYDVGDRKSMIHEYIYIFTIGFHRFYLPLADFYGFSCRCMALPLCHIYIGFHGIRFSLISGWRIWTQSFSKLHRRKVVATSRSQLHPGDFGHGWMIEILSRK